MYSPAHKGPSTLEISRGTFPTTESWRRRVNLAASRMGLNPTKRWVYAYRENEILAKHLVVGKIMNDHHDQSEVTLAPDNKPSVGKNSDMSNSVCD